MEKDEQRRHDKAKKVHTTEPKRVQGRATHRRHKAQGGTCFTVCESPLDILVLCFNLCSGLPQPFGKEANWDGELP